MRRSARSCGHAAPRGRADHRKSRTPGVAHEQAPGSWARREVVESGTIGRMTIASWNGTVLAESDDIVTVEGNAYFPRESVREDVLRPSDTHTVCPWKGTASYL